MHLRVFMFINEQPVKSVLIFSNGELIGDGMMKLPFIKALPEAFPNAEITWLAGRHATIFKTALSPIVSPYIHNVIDQTGFGDKWTHIWQNPCKILLPKEGFDVILDTEKKAIPPFMLRRIPHKLYISAAYRWAFSDRKPKQPYQKPLLLVDRLMDLLNVATNRSIKPIYGVEVPAEWKEHAAYLLKDYLGNKKIDGLYQPF